MQSKSSFPANSSMWGGLNITLPAEITEYICKIFQCLDSQRTNTHLHPFPCFKGSKGLRLLCRDRNLVVDENIFAPPVEAA